MDNTRPTFVRAARDARGGGARERRRRWPVAALAGFAAAAVLGAGAQAAVAQTTLNIGVANNVYPVFKELAGSNWLSTRGPSAVTPFTFNEATQAGGFWRVTRPEGGNDNTTLRGITSGNFRKQLLGPPPYNAPGAVCQGGSINTVCKSGALTDIDGFFSADLGNANQVIPNGMNGGTCVTGEDEGQGEDEEVTQCPGAPSTKRRFTVGRIALYSCNEANFGNGASPGTPNNPGGAVDGSGNGAPTSPRCDADELDPQITTMAQLITWLGTPGNRVSIADPASAPFGAAARQAIISASNQTFYDDRAQPALACDADPDCQIRLEVGITQVRGAVTSGTTQIGIASLSNLRRISWTSGTLNGTTTNDPNFVTVIPEAAYTAYGMIEQYAVRTSATNATFTDAIITDADDGILSVFAQGVFADYGYLPLS